MTEARTLDVSHLPPYDISNQSPVWWGQALMALIEASLFLMMIGVYFYLRISVDVWPPPGVQLPPVLLPSLGLVPLALSCVASWWASEGAKKNDLRQMRTGLIANLALGLIYLALRWQEWRLLNFNWMSDVHGSVVWTLLFLHTADAVADLIFTAVLIAILFAGPCGPKQRIGVHVDSVLWYFIAAIWIPLYVTLYWGPRFAGTR